MRDAILRHPWVLLWVRYVAAYGIPKFSELVTNENCVPVRQGIASARA